VIRFTAGPFEGRKTLSPAAAVAAAIAAVTTATTLAASAVATASATATTALRTRRSESSAAARRLGTAHRRRRRVASLAHDGRTDAYRLLRLTHHWLTRLWRGLAHHWLTLLGLLPLLLRRWEVAHLRSLLPGNRRGALEASIASLNAVVPADHCRCVRRGGLEPAPARTGTLKAIYRSWPR